MVLFVVPVGNVVGQTNSANAIRIDVYEKCEFKTMELYKFQQAWFVFQSKDSLTQITVADHIATYAPAPVFDTVIVYDKNMTVVAVFSEDSADWSEIVSTPMVGSDYYLYVKSNSYFDKCDFDMCLERGCVPDIDMPNLIYCANDNYFVVEYTACQTGTIGNLFINDNTLIESQQIQTGAMPYTYYFSMPFTTPGTYSITFCIFSTFSNVNEYCETFTITILPPPTIQITEGDVTICPGEFCFHDITTDAYEVDWDLYYNYPGVGWVDENHQWNNNPNDEYCHTFTNFGSYQLIATATGVCGTDESTVNISVLPPTAEFDWTNACVGQSVCFTGIANCGEFWHWDFGDGSTSTDQNPCHVYSQAGNYLVTLEVSPGITVSHTITVYSPVQPVISGDDYACGTSSHYQVTPAGAFSQIGWAVNSPSGW
ncbi:MAG: PKD domain-containing protein, partial [Bacteroidales bacterium]